MSLPIQGNRGFHVDRFGVNKNNNSRPLQNRTVIANEVRRSPINGFNQGFASLPLGGSQWQAGFFEVYKRLYSL